MEDKEKKVIMCPLCRARGVIKFVPRTTRTVNTNTSGRKGLIGAYRRERSGGYYSLEHAQKCPKLIETINPKSILGYHLELKGFWTGGHSLEWGDFKTYKNYKDLFVKFGFEIVVFTNPDSLEDTDAKTYILHKETNQKFLETPGWDKENSFAKLKGRLIAGEIIELADGKRYQLISNATEFKIKELKPLKND